MQAICYGNQNIPFYQYFMGIKNELKADSGRGVTDCLFVWHVVSTTKRVMECNLCQNKRQQVLHNRDVERPSSVAVSKVQGQ